MTRENPFTRTMPWQIQTPSDAQLREEAATEAKGLLLIQQGQSIVARAQLAAQQLTQRERSRERARAEVARRKMRADLHEVELEE